MAVRVTPATELLIQEQIDSGRYRDADEVIRKAVTLLANQDQEAEELRRSIEEAREELHSGGGEYFTPELHRKMWESALRRAQSCEKPNKDVMP